MSNPTGDPDVLVLCNEETGHRRLTLIPSEEGGARVVTPSWDTMAHLSAGNLDDLWAWLDARRTSQLQDAVLDRVIEELAKTQ